MSPARALPRLLLLATLTSGAPARAAPDGAPRGNLTGQVLDQAGAPLRGIEVAASPEAAGAEAGKATSNEEGRFALTLRPGLYTVAASAPKLKTVRQRHVAITAGQTSELALVMEVESSVEAVALVERAPSVSTTKGNVKESYDLDFVESLPPRTRDQRRGDGLAPPDGRRSPPPVGNESYDDLTENPFVASGAEPLSTFAIDVDTASYANVRRFIEQGALPPAGAVRVEELVNYFPYQYAPPRRDDEAPFAGSFEVGPCPWNDDARLVRIGLRGRELAAERRPAANLVFLIDVSGSMDDPRKLPLVKASLRLLVAGLRAQDRVALAVYAGSAGLVLPSTPAAERGRILAAIEALGAGGSTNGGEGIQLAYRVARAAFLRGGTNRVILATDGDFNVGVTSQDELVRLIEREAKAGVFLTVLGYGLGNLKDATMEKLADWGNGNYAYIDSLREARKVLVEQVGGTLVTIAKDVKIQVELNPARVGAYRLLGYEDRLMPKQDFNDDDKDGGEIGAGHTVTALYEVVPPGPAAARALGGASTDPLRYSTPPAVVPDPSADLMTVKVRYKAPDGDSSRKLEWPVKDGGAGMATLSDDLRFASAVAAFALVLRASSYRGSADLELVRRLGRAGLGADPGGYRRDFLALVDRSATLVAGGWAPGGAAEGTGQLVISQEGRREVRLAVAGRRLDGEVRGAPVHVVVKKVEIVGHMAGEPVWIWLHGREAEGHIGGHDVGFTLAETPTGHLLTGTAVGHIVRIEESNGLLSWLPSCERPLTRLPRGKGASAVYQGACSSGTRVRLTLPDQLDDVPPLPRLILLALLLTENDERLSAWATELFPTEAKR